MLDGDKVLRAVKGTEIEDLIRQHKVSGGMILKLEAAKRALAGGVSEVRIVGGTQRRALLTAVSGTSAARARACFPRFAIPRQGRSRARSRGLNMAEERNRTPRSVMSPAQIVAESARYLMNTYRRPPVVFTHGRGCRLYDSQGRAYLDFLAGIAVNALGYAHPRMVRVIRREAGRATHISNLFHNPYQAPLARKLAEWSGLDRVFFSNSGSEAMEGALKLARAYAHAKTAASAGGRPKTRILALENSFHGRTFGALSITHTAKYREPFEPLVPGVEFVRFNDVADLEAKFDESVCAIVIEPIQGEGGIFPVSEAFWQRARALATQYDAALIADEIQIGLGRTGRYFAYQKFGKDALPDIVTVAKPLAGGLPLGAFIANEQFASAFSPGMHGSTFGGGPLACAAALEFLTIVEEDDLLANVRDRGAELRARARKAGHALRFHPRGARRRADPRHRSFDRRRAFRAGSASQQPADQLHARAHPAPAAALHHSPARTWRSFSASSKRYWRRRRNPRQRPVPPRTLLTRRLSEQPVGRRPLRGKST